MGERSSFHSIVDTSFYRNKHTNRKRRYSWVWEFSIILVSSFICSLARSSERLRVTGTHANWPILLSLSILYFLAEAWSVPTCDCRNYTNVKPRCRNNGWVPHFPYFALGRRLDIWRFSGMSGSYYLGWLITQIHMVAPATFWHMFLQI